MCKGTLQLSLFFWFGLVFWGFFVSSSLTEETKVNIGDVGLEFYFLSSSL